MTMKNKFDHISLLGACILVAILAGGCATDQERRERLFVKLNNEAAGSLACQLHNNRHLPVTKDDPILVATVADVDRLETSSALGRITAEQIASRLGQLGYNVTEVKVRGDLFVQRERGEFKNSGSPFGGEFILSRNVEQIAAEHHATVIIAGTYTVGQMHSFISLRAIDVGTKRIIAGFNYAVPVVPWQWVNPLPEERRK